MPVLIAWLVVGFASVLALAGPLLARSEAGEAGNREP